MIPVTQTTFGYPEGNCLMACIASVLEVPLESLPNLYDRCTKWNDETKRWEWGDWWEVTVAAVREHGWEIVYVKGADRYRALGWTILGGNSPRTHLTTEDGKNIGHYVVAFDGEVVHDPHPDRTGITSRDEYLLLLPPLARPSHMGKDE